ncbi:MAG: hypothetical protein ACX93T_04465, partial [Bacteroidota bacterium]
MMKKIIFYSFFLFTLVASCNKYAHKPPSHKLPQDINTVYQGDLEIANPCNTAKAHGDKYLVKASLHKEARKQTAFRLAEDCKEEVEHKEARKQTAFRLAEDCKDEVEHKEVRKQTALRLAEDCK